MEKDLAKKMLDVAIEEARLAGFTNEEIQDIVKVQTSVQAPDLNQEENEWGQIGEAGLESALKDIESVMPPASSVIKTDSILEGGVPVEKSAGVSPNIYVIGTVKITPEVTGPVVTYCDTEVAKFSDGSVVVRQRAYLNKNFAPYRTPHQILMPDVFREVFKVGYYLGKVIELYKNPPNVSVDGNPGNAMERMMKS